MRLVGLDPRFLSPLSAQLLRRPAPAHRHRPRARAEARPRAVRRAGVGARRVDPGADPQPAEGPADRARAHLPVHLAQPRGRRLHRRRDRRDVPRPHRRDRAARSAVPQSRAPVHAADCSPRCRTRTCGAGSISPRCRKAPRAIPQEWRAPFAWTADDAGEHASTLGDGHLRARAPRRRRCERLLGMTRLLRLASLLALALRALSALAQRAARGAAAAAGRP